MEAHQTSPKVRGSTCIDCGNSFDYDARTVPTGIDPSYCHECDDHAEKLTHIEAVESVSEGDRVVVEFQNWDYDRKTVVGTVMDAGRSTGTRTPYLKLLGVTREDGILTEDTYNVTTRNVSVNGSTTTHHGRPRVSVYVID